MINIKWHELAVKKRHSHMSPLIVVTSRPLPALCSGRTEPLKGARAKNGSACDTLMPRAVGPEESTGSYPRAGRSR